MKKALLVFVLLTVCAFLYACGGDTLKNPTTETNIETPTNTSSTTTAEKEIKLYDYNFTIEHITTPIDWCYSFDVAPEEYSVSFRSPEVWVITEESTKVNENAFYALSDNSVLLTFYKVWDSDKISNNEVFPLTTDNGKIYNLVKYSYDEYERYNYSVPLSNNLTTVFSIEGSLDEDNANKYAKPIIDSIEFNGADIYSEALEVQEENYELKEVNLSTYFGISVADYGNPVMQSSAPFELFANLPASWEFYDSKSSAVNEKIYAENAPIDSIYKNSEHFAYSSIKPLLCYILNGELTQEWVAEIGVPHLYQNYKNVYEGTTVNGKKYIIYYSDIPSYHAKEYLCYAEFEFNNQKYVFEFKAYADAEDADLIEKVIDSVRLVTEPEIIKEPATVLCNLSWVSSYSYRIHAQKVDISFSVPTNFKAVNTHTFDSLTEKEQFKLFYELYKTDSTIPLSQLPRQAVFAAKLVETLDTPEMLAEVYMHNEPKFNNGYIYQAVGYGLIDGGYAIPFEFYCNDRNIDIVPSLLSAISVTEPQDIASKNADDVLLDEELKTINISDPFLISHSTMYESDGENLPPNCYIELDLPASWELLGKDSTMSNAIYSELGVPSTSLSPEKCLFQGFASDCLYTSQSAILGETEGTTDKGRMYWIDTFTYDYYHAVEYYIDVQISEEYIYSFTLCVDKDNTDLVWKVIDSVSLHKEEHSVSIESIHSVFKEIFPIELTVETPLEITVSHVGDIGDIRFSTSLYEIDSSLELNIEVIDELRSSAGTWMKTDELYSGRTTDGRKYVIVFEEYSTHGPYCTGFLQIAPNYMWSVSYEKDTEFDKAVEIMRQVFENASLSGEVPPLKFAPQSACDLTAFSLNIDRYRNYGGEYFDVYEDGFLNAKISLLLPNDFVKTDIYGAGTVFTNSQIPKVAFSAPEDNTVCPFPCFKDGDGLIERIADPDVFDFEEAFGMLYPKSIPSSAEITEGTTAKGLSYFLYREEITDYGSAKYIVLIKVNEEHLYHFTLHCDIGDSKLIKSILDSVSFEIFD